MPENFEKEERTEITNKDKFYFVLSYIPFLNLILFFTEIKDEIKDLKKYKTQWLTIFIIYLVLLFIFSIIWIWWLITLLYICLVIFLSLKAYNLEYFDIPFLDKIIKTFMK